MGRRLMLAAAFLGLSAAAASAATCPEPRNDGGKLSFTATRLAQAHYTDVIAGGRVSLAACAAVEGDGHVTPTPDFNVMLAGNDGRNFELRTAADCDAVLLVATADGQWRYDDDSAGGGQARIVIDAAPDGRYDVWVGTFAEASCRARLILQTHR
jgi:hypothetical protein